MKDKEIYGFDSFKGLEEQWRINTLENHFDLDNKLPECEDNVKLIIGKVQDTLDAFLQENNGCFQFIHFDMDTFTPTDFVLKKIRSRLKKNSVILFDELHGFESWESHEYKALKENLSEDDYDFIGFSKLQGAIVIKKD